MKCSNCQQPVEPEAAFCGNCGKKLIDEPQQAVSVQQRSIIGQKKAQQSSSNQAASNDQEPRDSAAASTEQGQQPAQVPAYAVADHKEQSRELVALFSLLAGVMGIASAVFLPVVGLGLGATGIVLGTMSRQSTKRRLSTAGLIVSSLAILAAMGAWVYIAQHNDKAQKAAAHAHAIHSDSKVAGTLSTGCYSVIFQSTFHIGNDSDSCDMEAYNGVSMSKSSEIYKVYANSIATTNASNFSALARAAIEKDVQQNLAGFTIKSEQATRFANSQAYIVTTYNPKTEVAVVEAAVLHPVSAGNNNVFIMVHAIAGQSTDLKDLEGQWIWK